MLPVSAGRTGEMLNTQRTLYQLHADQAELRTIYEQLSTGRRLARLSDDPTAGSRALGLQRSIQYSEQLVRNAAGTESFYAAADRAIAEIDAALIDGRTTAVEAAQTTLSDEQRQTLADSVRGSMNQILVAANTRFQDHRLLGGILQSGPAYRDDGTTVLFSGNDAVGQTQVSSGSTMATGVSVDAALGSGRPLVTGEPLDAVLNRDTRLVDIRSGRGAATGLIRISDGSSWQDVDLRSAATVGDAADILESLELGGRTLTVTVNDDGMRVEYTDGVPGTLAIADVPGGTTAADLQLANADGSRPPPLVSTGMAPRVTTSTPLADLNGASGVDVSGGLRIAEGDRVFQVALDEAKTVGDVLVAVNRSGAAVRATLNAEAGRIEIHALRAGVDYSVGEDGGSTAADLGIRSATRDTMLDALGKGRGVTLLDGAAELTLVRPDGRQLDLQLEGLRTVGDVLDAVNNHLDNQDTRRVIASLATVGNGITLRAPPGAGPLLIRQAVGTDAGQRLGLIPSGQTEAAGTLVGGAATIQGADYRPAEEGGAIDTLLRMETAVRQADMGEIARLHTRLDDNLQRASAARGRVGFWSQSMEILRQTAESEATSLKDQLSQEVDTDFAAVVTAMNLRQAAMEASMRLIGQTARMSVLNFL